MKVVIFSSTGQAVGGAVMCLKQIVKYLLNREIDLFIILRTHGTLEDFLRQCGVRYEIIAFHDWLRLKKDHDGLKNNLKWSVKRIHNSILEKRVYKILQREKPDVYHLNVIYNSCGAESAHRLGIPVVWHLREFAELDDDTPFFRDRKKAYDLISCSDKIICVSDCIKAYYSQYMSAEHMVRIYDGIAMPTDKIKQREKKDKFCITLSGGARVKGHKDLILAAQIMREQHCENFHINIAGQFADGKYLELLRSMVTSNKLDDMISFLGFQKDMDIVWSQTDVAVVCSRYESFGLSVCEAMARAIPAVCAKSTGTYEITNQGEYAQIYDVGHPEQLANALIDIFQNYETYAEHAVYVAKEIRNMYSIEKSCRELESVYYEVSKKHACMISSLL